MLGLASPPFFQGATHLQNGRDMCNCSHPWLLGSMTENRRQVILWYSSYVLLWKKTRTPKPTCMLFSKNGTFLGFPVDALSFFSNILVAFGRSQVLGADVFFSGVPPNKRIASWTSFLSEMTSHSNNELCCEDKIVRTCLINKFLTIVGRNPASQLVW